MPSFDDRAEIIEAAKHNYIMGEWSRTRTEPVLFSCGMTATEVNDFFRENVQYKPTPQVSLDEFISGLPAMDATGRKFR